MKRAVQREFFLWRVMYENNITRHPYKRVDLQKKLLENHSVLFFFV